MSNENRIEKVLDELFTNSTDRDLFATIMGGRNDILEYLADPRRNVYHECGFPADITNDQFSQMYQRNGIAKKVVEIRPNHCWKMPPVVIESSDSETQTEFESAFEDLHSQLRVDDIPEESGDLESEEAGWFKDSQSSPVWQLLKSADVKSGIGKRGFCVILLGLDGDDDYLEPVQPKPNGRRLIYAEVYDENSVSVLETETEKSSRRCGRPKIYQLTNDEGTLDVHHSRIVHVCKSPSPNEYYHRSEMEPVYNYLHGIDKVSGAAPEGYWRMAFTKLLLESAPGLTKADIDQNSLRKEIQKFEQSLSSVLPMIGMKGTAIAPKVGDPNPFYTMLVGIIATTVDCPIRVFMGTERGELGSSQDKQEWNETIMEIQNSRLSPCLVSKFINRLIWIGVLPVPKDGYSIKWPDLNELDIVRAADVTGKRVEAMSKYVAGDVSLLMSEGDFLVMEMGYTPEQAAEILSKIEIPDDTGEEGHNHDTD